MKLPMIEIKIFALMSISLPTVSLGTGSTKKGWKLCLQTDLKNTHDTQAKIKRCSQFFFVNRQSNSNKIISAILTFYTKKYANKNVAFLNVLSICL